jgi:hypothetical protein
MSWIAAAVIGSSVVSGVVQSKAAKTASTAQVQAADRGVEEQRRQFDAVQQLLKPYIETGTTALSRQAALMGLGGEEAQRSAITALEQGPEFAALTRQGEEAILQNAAATGGLRGGNVQAALAQFRPQILSGLIEQQYSRLGGLASQGQASAVGQAEAGLQTGQNISSLYGQIGASQAGAALQRGQVWGNLIGDTSMLLGRGAALQGYTPKGATAPLTFGQGMFYSGGAF